MPAARPRMHVTPSETVYRLLQEIAQLTKQPPATIVRELLDEAVPALEAAVEALRVVSKRPEEAQAAMARFSSRAINELQQAQLDLDSAMKKKPGPKPAKAPSKGHAAPTRGRGAAKTG